MSEKETSKGQLVGRVTELGCVTYYFRSENLYEVTCNCGVTFTVQVAKAKLSSLGCKDCIKAMMAAHGKKARIKQVKATGTPNPSEYKFVIEED